MAVFLVVEVTNGGGWALTTVKEVCRTRELAKKYIHEHQFEIDEETWFEIEEWHVKGDMKNGHLV